MNAHTSRFNPVLATAALAALMLSGCGGGGSDSGDRPTADLAQLSSVATKCGVTTLASLGNSGSGGLTTDSVTVNLDGNDEVVSYLGAGDYVNENVLRTLRIPLSDLRDGASDGDTGDDNMGVAVTGPYLLGSAGCIKAVGKLREAEGDGPNPMIKVWSSEGRPSLPVSALAPRQPINGVEFLSNFNAESLVAQFKLSATVQDDSNDMEICRLEDTSTWTCVPAPVTRDGAYNRISATISGPGVYVLTSVLSVD